VDLALSGLCVATSALVIGPRPLDLRSSHVTQDHPEIVVAPLRWQTVDDFLVLATAICTVIRWAKEARAHRIILLVIVFQAELRRALMLG
jgi:hypothetical protein